ncbi:MAG: glycoside hydrolase family 27 protein [Eubacteriales bacterium]
MLSKKPPMGWNSWNTFQSDISEELIMQTADAMVERGLRDAGYEYVVIDDCWSLKERVDGKIVADPEKFPHGMKYLSDYVHSKGLKFGMYSCAGTKTCAGYPGSLDHEFVDAQTFADWGVDFLKYDYCNMPDDEFGDRLYHRMSIALKATGREILFSACNWGSNDVEKWIRSTGAHMYRSTGDIYDHPFRVRDIFRSQIDKISYSMPGCFNDLDMLVVGMRGIGRPIEDDDCTDEEYRTHFALWCLFMSPLIIGADVRNMKKENGDDILLDKDFLALDQDEAGIPPFVIKGTGSGKYAFMRHLANGEYCLAFVNLCPPPEYLPAEIYANFEYAGFPANSGYEFEVYDMFEKKEIGRVSGGMGVNLKPMQSAFYRLRPVKK